MRFLPTVRIMLAHSASLIANFVHGALVVIGAFTLFSLGAILLKHGIDTLRPIAAPWLTWTQQSPRALAIEDSLLKASPRTRSLAGHIARKYRISSAAALELLLTAEEVAEQEGIEPMLIIAVMAIESSFNPIAESNMGAVGLMQVIPRFHQDKLDDENDDLLDPTTNIRVGARVLKSYLNQTGSLIAGLQVYGGAANDPDTAYANRVLAEKQRLEEAIRRARGVPA
ncbi:MAG: hypothetical protein RIR70_2174 [Pseudomonadota bacterium]|jgi:hypothetical protein